MFFVLKVQKLSLRTLSHLDRSINKRKHAQLKNQLIRVGFSFYFPFTRAAEYPLQKHSSHFLLIMPF